MQTHEESKQKQAKASMIIWNCFRIGTRAGPLQKAAQTLPEPCPDPPQILPKPTSNPPKSAPRAPKSVQKRPRASKSAPKAPNKRPKGAPRAPKCCQNPLQDLPKWSPDRYKNQFLRVFVACVFQHEFSIHFFVIFRICVMSPTLNLIAFLEGKTIFFAKS